MTDLAKSPHVDDEALLRRACNELTTAEEARVSAHLARCEACREVWLAVEAVRSEAVEFDPGAVAPVGSRLTLRRLPSRWRVGGLAAALLAASLVVWLGWPSGRFSPRGDVVRSGSLEAPVPLSPAEGSRVRRPEISWLEVEGAAAYTVELIDGRGEPLWTSARLTGAATPWPATVEPRPGRYFWRVSAHFDDGGEPLASPLVSFQLIAE